MVKINLPVKYSTVGYGVNVKYYVIDRTEIIIATFYQEPLVKSYVNFLNSLNK